VRHPLRRVGRPFDVREADRAGAGRSAELDALDLDVLAVPGAPEHVVERSTGIAERVGSVGDDDRRVELHALSIARG
jgi:hypothetical protein